MSLATGADVGNVEPSRKFAARLDGAIAGTALLLTALTAISLAFKLQVRLVAPALDLVLDALTAFVTISVAVLGWVRFRERGEAVALFQAAAFLVLALANALSVGLVMVGLDARAGMSLSAPGQAPLYIATAARLYAGTLLVIGGLASLTGRHARWPGVVLAACGAAMLVTIATVESAGSALPSLGAVQSASSAGAGGSPGPMPAPTVLGATVQVVGAALFLWASGLSRRLFRRDGAMGDAYLAVGLVFAAFAQVQTALYPGAYTGLVTSGNVLRLAFDLTLLLGIQAEAGAALAGLRRANRDLARLATVEVERAALEERTRISRELHDGLAQNLWLAKLKAGRLASLPDLGLEARALTEELGTAIDTGLAEAQQAVAALRLSGSPQGSLAGLLERMANDFADRFGLRVECSCAADLPSLPPRVQAEMLRIAQEALSNVQRHADATLVRVCATLERGDLVLSVRDNGRGFDPATVGEGSYGLASMRERAALIGGELLIDSRSQDGTRVQLIVPMGSAGAGPAAVTASSAAAGRGLNVEAAAGRVIEASSGRAGR